MPVSDYKRDYLLDEAFDAVGRHIFGIDWTGNELLFASEVKDPNISEQEAAPIREREAAILKKMDSVDDQIASSVGAEQVAALQRKKERLRDDLVQAGNELRRVAPTDAQRNHHDACTRRDQVCAVLVEALKAGSISVYIKQGFIIPAHYWDREPHFHYRVDLSVVFLPQHLSSKRTGAARVQSEDFDVWLEKQPRLQAGIDAPLSNKDQARRFLVNLDKAENGRKPASRDEIFEWAKADIPGLSQRDFRDAWRDTVRKSWQSSGRPPKAQ